MGKYAAPMVAGTAALVLSSGPSFFLQSDQGTKLKARILCTANKSEPLTPFVLDGNVLDAERAVNNIGQGCPN